MLKIERLTVMGFESAIRGMRNPLNSWDKSDSDFSDVNDIKIGPDDLKLMKTLVEAGSDHSKFMRMIFVSCDVTAPLYWWKEFDTYKVGTVRNSCSTMHTIHRKPFERNDFSYEHLGIFEWDNQYGEHHSINTLDWLQTTINELNWCREKYLSSKDKRYWWQMIQLLPSNYNQKATITFNYQVLRSMYHARKNHKLDEWHTFCDFCEGLPYSELITE